MEQDFQKYHAGKATSKEVEDVTRAFLKEKFNSELRDKISVQLANDKGIVRRPEVKFQVLRWSLSAAAVVLLAIGTWTWWLQPATMNYQQLADSYLAIPHPNSETRKSSLDISELEVEAITAYQDQNFNLAAKHYQELVNRQQVLNTLSTYYLGLSHLYQQPPQLEFSIKYLRQTIESENMRLADEASWYLSLALLKANNIDEAKYLLQKRVQNNGWKSTNAQHLLNVLP